MKELCDELQKEKQDIDNSEKKRKSLEQELLKAKQDMEEAKKKRAVVKAQVLQIKNYINWTQPIGTVQVDCSTDIYDRAIISLNFTFPEGIQTTRHPSPGNLIKGRKFDGSLLRDPEGKLLCRMLKAAFRRGLMFTLGNEGKVNLDGISLYEFSEDDFMRLSPAYYCYVRTLQAELAVKGITKADIDQTETLEETFIVDGSSAIEETLRSVYDIIAS